MQSPSQNKNIVLTLEENKRLLASILSYPLVLHESQRDIKAGSFDEDDDDDDDDEELMKEFYILVVSVEADGEAAKHNLTAGDMLVAVDGIPIDKFTKYSEVLDILRVRRPLTVEFVKRPMAGRLNRREILEEIHIRALNCYKKLTKLAFEYGVVDEYRPIVWRAMLGYLPEDKSRWHDALKEHRELYAVYVAEFRNAGKVANRDDTSRPGRLHGQGWWETDHDEEPLRSNENNTRTESEDDIGAQHSDHLDSGDDMDNMPDPMSVSTEEIARVRSASETSRQIALEESNQELHETIWKDVQRTHPGFHFFADTRCEVMARLLFIYAKLNPGIKYVQGMNEIIAPLLFVFGSSSLDKGSENARSDYSDYGFDQNYEADTFFCFCHLMSELRDIYTMDLDSDNRGVRGKGEELMSMLQTVDPVVHRHLVSLDIIPQYFAMRWITTMLSREMELPDTVRLWDTIFAAPERPNLTFVLQVCCAMIVLQRNVLLRGDFSTCIQTLQKYPPTDIHEILNTVFQIRENSLDLKDIAKSTTQAVLSSIANKQSELSAIFKQRFSFR